MTELHRELLLLGFMLGLFGVSAWLVNTLGTSTPHASTDDAQLPAHVMQDFVTRTYGSDGALRQRLEGKQVMFFASDQDTLVDAPYIITYQNGLPHWYGRAEHGQLSADGKQMHLLGATRLWQPPDENSLSGLEIVSRDILLRSAEGYVETSEYAVLRSPKAVTEGKGLQAFTHSGQMRILADVKSVLGADQAPSSP